MAVNLFRGLSSLEQQIASKCTDVVPVGARFTVWLKVGARRFDLRVDAETEEEAEKERVRLTKALAAPVGMTLSPARPRF